MVFILCVTTSLSCSHPSTAQPTQLAGQSALPLELERCSIADLPDAKCGTYRVFEDRRRKRGREIALNVVVVPATTPVPDTAPIFWLDGGPGGAASEAAGYVSLKWLRGLHDEMTFRFNRRNSSTLFLDTLQHMITADPLSYEKQTA